MAFPIAGHLPPTEPATGLDLREFKATPHGCLVHQCVTIGAVGRGTPGAAAKVALVDDDEAVESAAAVAISGLEVSEEEEEVLLEVDAGEESA